MPADFSNQITSQINNDLSKKSKLFNLLNESSLIGYSFNVSYNSISILTNDFWKREVHGIPHNSFLIATSFDKNELATVDQDNKEIILLRVVKEASIPDEDVWVETRIAKIKSLKSPNLDALDNSSVDFDNYTLNEMGYTGLECSILGTFFEDEENSELNFGSDLENYFGTKSLYIYKPLGSSLEKIINFIDPYRIKSIQNDLNSMGINLSTEKIEAKYEIGTVRYTSTNRLQKSTSSEVKVTVNPFDFIARRTATFGMTRTGKSNTVKTLIDAIDRNCKSTGIILSQIIFDLNGEYANPNLQDINNSGEASSISSSIPGSIVYTLNPNVQATKDIRLLRFNFFKNIQLAHQFITSIMKNENTSTAADITSFINLDINAWFEEDDELDPSTKNRITIKKNLYYILLHSIGCKSGNSKINFPFSKSVLTKTFPDIIKTAEKNSELSLDSDEEILKNIYLAYKNLPPRVNLNLPKEEVFRGLKAIKTVLTNQNTSLLSSSGKEMLDDDMKVLFNLITQSNDKNTYIQGYKAIAKLGVTRYHEINSNDYTEEIVNYMKEGKVIILDVSLGIQDMRTRITELIFEKIFINNQKEFTEGIPTSKVIFYVEEAHNLIGKKMEPREIWPRVAKEGAKYGIGLVYSTQEPSSINKNVLSNTENWFITHLNNEDEIRVISKYYDFGDFKSSLMKAKDVGFARIKTMSQNFVVPVQIKKFEG